MGNLRLVLFVSSVNQIERGREMSPRFPFVNPGVTKGEEGEGGGAESIVLLISGDDLIVRG